MQQADYNSYYQFPHNPNPSPNPNPHPPEFHQPSYASAPPYTSGYAPSDPPLHSQSYPTFPLNPDPTAPSYITPSSIPAPPPPPVPTSINSFNPTPPPAAPTFPPYDSQYQPPASQSPYLPPYDQHQAAASYAPQPNSTPSPTPNPNYYSSPYSYIGNSVSSGPAAYDNPYENSVKFDQGGGHFDDNKYGGNSRSRSDLVSDLYGKQSDSFLRYGDDGYGDGVYAYEGKAEPYGARGTAPKSSTWVGFDDYGRSISFPSGKDSSVSSASPKIVRAVPKAESQQDVKGGVQKFRVKILAESGGQSTMDVLCQIGLDGVRMLDPSTSRTLRIYPLENITRCEVMDSSTLAFWSKSFVDIEPRRIRLQSNSYTTNTLLDIITAATVQFKEMGGRSRPSEVGKTAEQATEKKKGLGEWINFIKPGNEEKDHWVPDEAVSKCNACGTDFGAFVRRHHCRNCGDIFCDKCTHGRIALTADENAQPVRVCDRCMAEVTQRLSNAKEAANKPAIQSHEDLARKLQEEMEKNRRTSSGSKSEGSGRRMKEVACPTCTVHLQVQVPSSGSETIECGVCQHPFLVSAH